MAIDISTLRVLVVDDQPQTLKIIKATLGELGVGQVHTAVDGTEALTYLGLADRLVDVVVCDWNMPKMNGLDVLKFVRAAIPDMPFLMITGLATEAQVQEAMRFGISAYIAKPFTPEELEAKISYLAGLLET